MKTTRRGFFAKIGMAVAAMAAGIKAAKTTTNIDGYYKEILDFDVSRPKFENPIKQAQAALLSGNHKGISVEHLYASIEDAQRECDRHLYQVVSENFKNLEFVALKLSA